MDEMTAEATAGREAEAQADTAVAPEQRCDSCARLVAAGARFCPYCGSALSRPDFREGDVPWRVEDVLYALIIPGLFFALGVLSIIVAGEQEELTEAELITTLVISLGFQLFLLGLVWFFSVRKYHVPWAALGLRRWTRGAWWSPFAVVAGAFVIVYAWVLVLVITGLQGDGSLPDETFDYTSTIILLGILSVIFAPVVEEVFFRGFVFGGFAKRTGPVPAMLLSGLIFALAHAGSPESLLILPAIGAIGVLFAWAYWYTGSLYASIGAHFIFNSTQLVIGILAS